MALTPPLTADDRRQLAGLALLGALVLVLLVVQRLAVGRTMLFLVWNLFLAIVPVMAAWAARRMATRAAVGVVRSRRRGLVFLALSLLWLFFFPNAPYVATDLMHLRNSKPDVLLLDVLLLGSAASAGIYAGLLSLRWMHQALLTRGVSAWLGWTFIVAAALAAGFGVFLGRFQRWNTWDILTRPGDVLAGAWSSLGEDGVAFTFALLFAFGLTIGYAVLTLLLGGPGPTEAHRRGSS